MTTPEERDALIAAVTSAHRERSALGAIRAHRAFHDLDEAGRVEAFEETLRVRAIERALGPTSTARAILARITR